jgi:two-component system, cell cycle response regulator
MTINSLTTKQVIIRIIVIVSSVEFLIMLAFGFFDYKVNVYVKAGTDILALAALSTPLIVILVVTPFVRARDEALTRLNNLAGTDPLTNLLNRRSIYTQLHKYIASAIRHHFYGAVLLIDLDGFKYINDTHGHDAGDKVLVDIANRLRSRVRMDEVVGRLGGDEFILLINNLDTDENVARKAVLRIAGQLVALVSQPINYNDKKFTVGASIGIRIFGLEEIAAESAIKDADRAMYRAKEAGKGQCVVFEN